MKRTMGNPEVSVQEPVTRDWLCYELTEDDFLLGKTSEFFPDAWEDDE